MKEEVGKEKKTSEVAGKGGVRGGVKSVGGRSPFFEFLQESVETPGHRTRMNGGGEGGLGDTIRVCGNDRMLEKSEIVRKFLRTNFGQNFSKRSFVSYSAPIGPKREVFCSQKDEEYVAEEEDLLAR